MNYIIVDDEHIAHDIIIGYCNMMPNYNLVGQCYDGIEAIKCLRDNKVDLMFLDLNMPKLQGFDFLKTLQNPPAVIVTTAYKEHALDGYELNIVDYLLKPISLERFIRATNKLEKSNSETSKNIVVNNREESIFLRSNKDHVRIRLDSLLYIEASRNYCKVVTTEEELKVREKISDLLSLLPKESFIQVHRSFVVSVKHLNRVGRNTLQINDHSIPIGEMYRGNVAKLLGG